MVDLVDNKSTGEPIMHFESEEELSWYTRDTKKYFPRDNAYAGGLLKFLLRHIFAPGATGRKKRRAKRRAWFHISLDDRFHYSRWIRARRCIGALHLPDPTI